MTSRQGEKPLIKFITSPGSPGTSIFVIFSGYLKGITHSFLSLLVLGVITTNEYPGCLVAWRRTGKLGNPRAILREWPIPSESEKGHTMFENIFSWNKFANMLYLESPRGVGWSYQSNDDLDYSYTNNGTASDNLNAVIDFFENIFPEYKQNGFYISGESYAGVYIPMLADALIQAIQSGRTDINFKGIAVQSGFVSQVYNLNVAVHQLYLYGLQGKYEYDNFISRCCQGVKDPTTYGADPWCANETIRQTKQTWNPSSAVIDMYSLYLDCGLSPWTDKVPPVRADGFVDNAQMINLYSTDHLNGFPCWGGSAATVFMNQPGIREAMHIPDEVGKEWKHFNGTVGDLYDQSWPLELDAFIVRIVNSYYYKQNNMSLLFYNGDTDTVCSHWQTHWWLNRVAKTLGIKKLAPRDYWWYQKSAEFQPVMAGAIERFEKQIDFLTIKGAGHLGAADRPGPVAQVLYNFVNRKPYNASYPKDIKKKPLKQSFQSLQNSTKQEESVKAPPNNTDDLTSRAKSDLITSIPGLTFDINFHFGGYLHPENIKAHHLFYWFMESQNDQKMILLCYGSVLFMEAPVESDSRISRNPLGIIPMRRLSRWRRRTAQQYKDSPEHTLIAFDAPTKPRKHFVYRQNTDRMSFDLNGIHSMATLVIMMTL
ncbi:unnamed protein product, partial [Mesorhabditis belari]|uniref:Carboxypeptidase n=1 Tax=Mesorhabditis belari TaxID=2138241 RepID=A0AAF3J8D3_9BILA